MPEKLLFEYAVIRVVPHVEREEFLNVGVILLCKDKKFLNCIIHIDEQRLKVFSSSIDLEELKQHIASFERICKSSPDSGAIGKLTISERFRWLTATRSTILQTSKVHPGLCEDPIRFLEKLYKQLVLVETGR